MLRFWLDLGVSGFRVDAVNRLYEVDPEHYGGRYPDEPPSGYSRYIYLFISEAIRRINNVEQLNNVNKSTLIYNSSKQKNRFTFVM